jgi:aspartyl aminopeptidase
LSLKKTEKKVTFALGEKETDPIFSVPDLLPHLSHKVQDNKKMDEAITGESLDILIGSEPIKGDISEKSKPQSLKN